MTSPEKPAARLFLSYGRRDAKDLADRLVADLEGLGYEVWQDARAIRAGTDWQQKIVDDLRSTQVVVALLSPHAVRVQSTLENSDEYDSVCLDELSFARFAHPPTPIVPAMAIPCEPPFCIFRLDYIDLCRWSISEDEYRAGFARLEDAIEGALRGEVRYRSEQEFLDPVDFGAYLNDRRRGFCGRRWLFKAIDTWRVSKPEERALLITGDPGTGKTAFVAELTHRNPGNQVLAYHCCTVEIPGSLEPSRFVQSIAAMIASQLDGYATQVMTRRVREALRVESCQRDPVSAFEEGVLAPLERLRAPSGETRCIVIDALDEALLVRTGELTIVDILALRLDRLPGWLRVVATTRKDPEIALRLERLRAREIDAQDPRNLEDIALFIRERLRTPILARKVKQSGIKPDVVADALRDKSEGNFLYVQRSLEGIERETHSLTDLDRLPPGLDALYQSTLDRLFGTPGAYASARRVLEVLIAAREPLTERIIADAAGLEREEELPGVLRTLSVCLRSRLRDDGAPCYTIFHKSFADWLTDRRRRTRPFSAVPQHGHRYLAECCWREYERGSHSMDPYALAHLPAHLIAAERWRDVEAVLTDLDFVGNRCKCNLAGSLRADYIEVLAGLPERRQRSAADRLRQSALTEYTRALVAFAASHKATPSRDLSDRHSGSRVQISGPLPEPPAVPELPDESEILADRDRVLGHPSRSDRIEAFYRLCDLEDHHFASYGSRPGFCLQQAFNMASDGPVCSAAEGILRTRGERGPMLLLSPPSRPGYAPNGTLVRTFPGHTGYVTALAMTPDGRTGASGSWDRTVRMWNLLDGRCRRVLDGHSDCIVSVAFSADARLVASGSADGTIRIWDGRSSDCLAVISDFSGESDAIAMTPDGGRTIYGGNDGGLNVLDLEHGNAIAIPVDGDSPPSSLGLTPDGHWAMAALGSTVVLWDLENQRPEISLEGHSSTVSTVAFTPDRRIGVSGSRDGSIRVWDLTGGQCLRELQGHEGPVRSVAMTPDGSRLVSASQDKSVKVWDLRHARELRVIRGHTAPVSAVGVTADGRTALTGSWDTSVRLWNLNGLEVPRNSPRHTDAVKSLSVSVDGLRILSGSYDETIGVWDSRTGKRSATLQSVDTPVRAVAMVPDGNWAVSAGRFRAKQINYELRLWDLSSGRPHRTLQGHRAEVRGLVVTPDGRRAVSASADGTLRVWDLDDGRCLRSLAANQGELRALALSPDGRVAVWGGQDRTIRLWDIESGDCLANIEGHQDEIFALAMAPDGRRIVSGSSALVIGDDKPVRVWDAATQKCVLEIGEHSLGVLAVAWTPDCCRVISGGGDRALRVFDVFTGRCECLAALPATIASVAVQANRIVVGDAIGEVYFFRLQNVVTGPPFVTPVRRYDLAERKWDSEITVVCDMCGHRGPVDQPVLDAIAGIRRDYSLPEDELASLALPQEAWNEPRLSGECRSCSCILQFNPFFVDRASP